MNIDPFNVINNTTNATAIQNIQNVQSVNVSKLLDSAVVCNYLLNQDEYRILSEVMAPIPIRFSDHPVRISHGIPAFLNGYAYDHCIKEAANIGATIDIGGNALRTPKNTHICALVNSTKTDSRYANVAFKQMNFLPNSKVDYRGYLTDGHDLCVNGVQECYVQARYAYMINVYDIPIELWPRIFVNHNLLIVDLWMFMPINLINDKLTNDNGVYRADHIRNKMKFSLHDCSDIYEHDFENWRKYYTVTQIKCKGFGLHLEIINERSTFKNIRITRTENIHGMTTRIINILNTNIIVPDLTVYTLNFSCAKDPMMRYFSLKRHFVERALGFGCTAADSQFNYTAFSQYVNTLKSDVRYMAANALEMVYEGISVEHDQFQNITISLFIIACVQRYRRTVTISRAMNKMKNNQIGTASFLSKQFIKMKQMLNEWWQWSDQITEYWVNKNFIYDVKVEYPKSVEVGDCLHSNVTHTFRKFIQYEKEDIPTVTGNEWDGTPKILKNKRKDTDDDDIIDYHVKNKKSGKTEDDDYKHVVTSETEMGPVTKNYNYMKEPDHTGFDLKPICNKIKYDPPGNKGRCGIELLMHCIPGFVYNVDEKYVDTDGQKRKLPPNILEPEDVIYCAKKYHYDVHMHFQGRYLFSTGKTNRFISADLRGGHWYVLDCICGQDRYYVGDYIDIKPEKTGLYINCANENLTDNKGQSAAFKALFPNYANDIVKPVGTITTLKYGDIHLAIAVAHNNSKEKDRLMTIEKYHVIFRAVNDYAIANNLTVYLPLIGTDLYRCDLCCFKTVLAKYAGFKRIVCFPNEDSKKNYINTQPCTHGGYKELTPIALNIVKGNASEYESKIYQLLHNKPCDKKMFIKCEDIVLYLKHHNLLYDGIFELSAAPGYFKLAFEKFRHKYEIKQDFQYITAMYIGPKYFPATKKFTANMTYDDISKFLDSLVNQVTEVYAYLLDVEIDTEQHSKLVKIAEKSVMITKHTPFCSNNYQTLLALYAHFNIPNQLIRNEGSDHRSSEIYIIASTKLGVDTAEELNEKKTEEFMDDIIVTASLDANEALGKDYDEQPSDDEADSDSVEDLKLPTIEEGQEIDIEHNDAGDELIEAVIDAMKQHDDPFNEAVDDDTTTSEKIEEQKIPEINTDIETKTHIEETENKTPINKVETNTEELKVKSNKIVERLKNLDINKNKIQPPKGTKAKLKTRRKTSSDESSDSDEAEPDRENTINAGDLINKIERKAFKQQMKKKCTCPIAKKIDDEINCEITWNTNKEGHQSYINWLGIEEIKDFEIRAPSKVVIKAVNGVGGSRKTKRASDEICCHCGIIVTPYAEPASNQNKFNRQTGMTYVTFIKQLLKGHTWQYVYLDEIFCHSGYYVNIIRNLIPDAHIIGLGDSNQIDYRDYAKTGETYNIRQFGEFDVTTYRMPRKIAELCNKVIPGIRTKNDKEGIIEHNHDFEGFVKNVKKSYSTVILCFTQDSKKNIKTNAIPVETVNSIQGNTYDTVHLYCSDITAIKEEKTRYVYTAVSRSANKIVMYGTQQEIEEIYTILNTPIDRALHAFNIPIIETSYTTYDQVREPIHTKTVTHYSQTILQSEVEEILTPIFIRKNQDLTYLGVVGYKTDVIPTNVDKKKFKMTIDCVTGDEPNFVGKKLSAQSFQAIYHPKNKMQTVECALLRYAKATKHVPRKMVEKYIDGFNYWMKPGYEKRIKNRMNVPLVQQRFVCAYLRELQKKFPKDEDFSLLSEIAAAGDPDASIPITKDAYQRFNCKRDIKYLFDALLSNQVNKITDITKEWDDRYHSLIQFHLKKQPKMIQDKYWDMKSKAGQGVSAWSKMLNVIFSSFTRMYNEFIVDEVKDNVQLSFGMSDAAISKFFNKYAKFLNSVNYAKIMADFSEFDSSHEEKAILTQNVLMRNMGFDGKLIDFYEEMRSKWTLFARLDDQRLFLDGVWKQHSGQPFTLGGNTQFNMMVMGAIYKYQNVILACFKGDDSYIVCEKCEEVLGMHKGTEMSLTNMCGYKIKMHRVKVGEYIANIVTPDGKFFPDVIRRTSRVISKIFSDKADWEEQRQSLHDAVDVIENEEDKQHGAYAASAFYKQFDINITPQQVLRLLDFLFVLKQYKDIDHIPTKVWRVMNIAQASKYDL
jgi:hypothetical protein